MPVFLHDLTFNELRDLLVADGLRPVHVKAVWNALHFRAETDLAARTDWVPPLQRWVAEKVSGIGEGGYRLDHLAVAAHIPSGDGLTQKYLLRLQDGQEIETVIMGYTGRHTVCVSTQAGCAMGCVFCATGQMGFVRHLRPGEIVGQVLHAQRILRAKGERLRNIVLMGMGEPLHNYDNVMKALDMISDTRGCNIGPSKISVSTVGVVPGILRLAAEARPYNLAISLHGSTEAERAALIPANQRWPLAELMAACRTYGETTGRRIFFAWTLIAGVNDTPEHARRVVALLQGIDAHLNLIPLNETAGYEGRESVEAAGDVFQRIVLEAGIPCTVRQRRGIDVAAGCGQLKAEKKKRRQGEAAAIMV
ncbi:23S rRNA (adenine(2503)-C(2))-methyltransferase RlmN [Prosthecobacter sp. SYSU 5D2]|uniref:23S rRNA (adenine(2503)-C(2))-methyltransferase RlmN n=1 Tax=Prosthecobacter sp. SYSU 5D2 TaxID=3134134 RepID=UPI0031FEB654